MKFMMHWLSARVYVCVLTYLHSASFHAMRRPFPPPPADALIITGYPETT